MVNNLRSKVRIVVAGSGFSGALLAKSLVSNPNLEVFYFERSFDTESQSTSTGFNINPNGMAALESYSPSVTSKLRLYGAPRSCVTAWDFSGNNLYKEAIFKPHCEGMATTTGLRIRWRDAYKVLRHYSCPSFGYEVLDYEYNNDGTYLNVTVKDLRNQRRFTIDKVCLLIGADGRYSSIRNRVSPPQINFIGVSNFRFLAEDTSEGLFDDMELFYNMTAPSEINKTYRERLGVCLNGLARVGVMRMPKHDNNGKQELYIYGNFPIAENIPEFAKTSDGIGLIYGSTNKSKLCPRGRYILNCLQNNAEKFHWVRMQSINSVFCDNKRRVLLLGDAAHATVPTLGQGATSAIEDSILAANILSVIDSTKFNDRIPELVSTIASKRTSRANFISQISIAASMHLTSGKPLLKLQNEIQGWRRTDSHFRVKYKQLMQDYPKSINFDSDSYKAQDVA